MREVRAMRAPIPTTLVRTPLEILLKRGNNGSGSAYKQYYLVVGLRYCGEGECVGEGKGDN